MNGNGNGNGDGGLSDSSYGGDFTGYSYDVPGANPSSDSEISTAVFGVEEGQAEFPAGPSTAVFGFEEGQPELSAPSSLPDLSEAFSPPGQPIDITTQIEGYEQAVEGQKGEFTLGLHPSIADTLGRIIDVLIDAVFSFVPGAQPVGFAVHGLERIGKTTPGQQFAGFLKGSYQGQPAPSTQAQPSPALSISRPSRGYQSNISLTDYTESYEGGIGAISVTPQAAIPSSKAYPSLLMSLFGTPKESSGGLMIFPTSTKGIEAEGSSLLKKQEPLIDTTSLLFLLGMGVVGMVLRKGARA